MTTQQQSKSGNEERHEIPPLNIENVIREAIIKGQPLYLTSAEREKHKALLEELNYSPTSRNQPQHVGGAK